MSLGETNSNETESINFEKAEEDCRQICRRLQDKASEYGLLPDEAPRKELVKLECHSLWLMAEGALRFLLAKWMYKEGLATELFWLLRPEDLEGHSRS